LLAVVSHLNKPGRVTIRLAVYRRSIRLGVKTLETHDQQFIFQLNTCGHSPHVTSSLTRGWVCLLQLLQVLASAVILRSDFRGTIDHNSLSQIRDSPNLEDQVPVFISPRNRVAQLHPQALGSLLVPSYDSQGGPHRKHRFPRLFHCCLCIHCYGNVFTESFPSNGSLFWLGCFAFQASCHNIHDLSNDTVRSTYYTLSNDRMVIE
jgi:hypothetical protein